MNKKQKMIYSDVVYNKLSGTLTLNGSGLTFHSQEGSINHNLGWETILKCTLNKKTASKAMIKLTTSNEIQTTVTFTCPSRQISEEIRDDIILYCPNIIASSGSGGAASVASSSKQSLVLENLAVQQQQQQDDGIGGGGGGGVDTTNLVAVVKHNKRRKARRTTSKSRGANAALPAGVGGVAGGIGDDSMRSTSISKRGITIEFDGNKSSGMVSRSSILSSVTEHLMQSLHEETTTTMPNQYHQEQQYQEQEELYNQEELLEEQPQQQQNATSVTSSKKKRKSKKKKQSTKNNDNNDSMERFKDEPSQSQNGGGVDVGDLSELSFNYNDNNENEDEYAAGAAGSYTAAGSYANNTDEDPYAYAYDDPYAATATVAYHDHDDEDNYNAMESQQQLSHYTGMEESHQQQQLSYHEQEQHEQEDEHEQDKEEEEEKDIEEQAPPKSSVKEDDDSDDDDNSSGSSSNSSKNNNKNDEQDDDVTLKDVFEVQGVKCIFGSIVGCFTTVLILLIVALLTVTGDNTEPGGTLIVTTLSPIPIEGDGTVITIPPTPAPTSSITDGNPKPFIATMLALVALALCAFVPTFLFYMKRKLINEKEHEHEQPQQPR